MTNTSEETLSGASTEDLLAELRARLAREKAEQYAPVREAYEPLRGFMSNQQPLTLGQLSALLSAPRPLANPASPLERNLDPLYRVLTSTKTVWDNTVGAAFADENQPEGA